MKIFALSTLSLACRAVAFGVGGSILTSNFALAQEMTVEKTAVSELPSLLAIYKDIHSHPELSTREEKTSALVAKELRATGCEVTENFGKYDNPNLKCYGVIGIMKNGTGPIVLVRTDMDALPVEEDTGLPYASVDSVDVTVRGVGGHGAYPHKTKDPIVLAAEMINAWQTIASRENNPLDPIVITVGSIHGGTKHNIIPDEVKMQLTVRTYKSDVRERVLAAIERIARGCATAAGLLADKMPTVNVLRDHFAPAMYNNPELTKRLVAVWKKALGDPNIEMVDPTMGGEDFSEYSLLPDHSIPAVNFHVGAVDPAKIAESKKPGAPPLPTLHSSKFAPVPEPTIRTGMVAMTVASPDLMQK